jgi:beta-glucanase (GH16 family)
MARRLATHVFVCSCLATVSLMLAGPAGGLALERHALRVRLAHPHRRCQGLGRRRGGRNIKKVTATCKVKRASASLRRVSDPAKGSARSSTTASVVSRASVAHTVGGSTPVDVPTGEPGASGASSAESPVPEAGATKESRAGSEPTNPRKLIWSDEFNGSAGASPDPSDWSFDTGGGGWGNEELESYTSRPANAELDGQGDLAITARAEKYTGADGVQRQYTSARLQTLNTFRFQYGLAEARIRVPAGQGLVAQFWMLGQEAYESEEAWPGCGEIDVAEVLGSEPSVVNGTLHAPWPWAPTGIQGADESATPLSAGFHTYSVEWEPERVSFMLDGSVYKTITRGALPAGAAWPFTHPYFLLLDLAVGGEWPGSPSSSTHFPAQMLVDWVRVWQ